jgi:hypothetical protein
MTTTQTLLRTAALALLAGGLVAQAATVTGTVTNKTTNKPSAGDTVVLVDVQASMGEVAHTTTDGSGHYTLNEPGSGPYLVRVAHQGATYFIGAPQGSAPGDIGVYDAAAKVDGIGVSADVIEFETGNGQLQVNERFFIHNNSNPARTQIGVHGFEIVLPVEAVLDGAAATRPTSTMPTNVTPQPTGQKGHYTINVPIQPNQGEKETVFDLRYHLPYDGKKYAYAGRELLTADNVAVLLPKSMSFSAGAGLEFKQVEEDPGILTFIAKNTPANRELAFTVSGEGSMPREDQSNQGAQGSAGMGTGDNKPGGGIGAPVGTPDPLNKYKWWILGALALALACVAAFLLRKPGGAAAAVPAASAASSVSLPVGSNAAILQVLKDELFALESEKLSGNLSAEEYDEVKAALETVLKRALKKS